jgi:hypothetical protein
MSEIVPTALNVIEQTFQLVSTFEAQSALAFIGIGARDLKTTLLCILSYSSELIIRRILLMFRGHPNISSSLPTGITSTFAALGLTSGVPHLRAS